MPPRLTRLTQPLVRDRGELRAATWDEALDRAAAGFRKALDAFRHLTVEEPNDAKGRAILANFAKLGAMTQSVTVGAKETKSDVAFNFKV